MEALSGRGWFDAAVRDAHYSARKAFFLPSVCISGAARGAYRRRSQSSAKHQKFSTVIERKRESIFVRLASLRTIFNNISFYPFIRR